MFRTRRRHLRAILRDAPLDTGTPSPGGGGAPTPAPTPAPAPPAPTEFDPATLSPEAKKWHEAQVKAADEKARTGTRDNAANAARAAVLDEFAQKLGLKPADVDPKALASELAESRATTAALRGEIAIGRACRKAEIGADEDLVTAYLARQGKLAELDPASKTYAADVEKLVAEAVAAKPALKLATTPSTPPPGGRQPAAGASFNRPGGGEQGAPPTFGEAVGAFYAQQ